MAVIPHWPECVVKIVVDGHAAKEYKSQLHSQWTYDLPFHQHRCFIESKSEAVFVIQVSLKSQRKHLDLFTFKVEAFVDGKCVGSRQLRPEHDETTFHGPIRRHEAATETHYSMRFSPLYAGEFCPAIRPASLYETH